jgi:zinc transport system ATP-binding protein
MTESHHKIAIELKDVSYSYGENVVLEKVSFQIADGDYVGVVGPNGGGKTTTLKIILGLLKPDSGTVRVFGHTLEKAKEHYEVGYVPQKVMEGEFSFPATVQEVIESGRISRYAVFQGFSPEDKKAIEKAIELTGIAGLQKRLIGELSGGQRQLVFIARALAREPRILILDEPTVGVDVASKDKFYSFLEKLNHEHKMTIVMVSHDVDVMVGEVKQILCLNKNLVCHVPSDSFEKGNFMDDVYGHKAHPIPHNH